MLKQRARRIDDLPAGMTVVQAEDGFVLIVLEPFTRAAAGLPFYPFEWRRQFAAPLDASASVDLEAACLRTYDRHLRYTGLRPPASRR